MPEALVFLAVAIAYLVAQRIIRTWVTKRWIDGRISNVGCVSIMVLTSGMGLGLFLIAASLVMHPSGNGLLALVIAAFVLTVALGFGMTAMAYASSHGVRENLQRQREQTHGKKRD